jgi:hypothetical protein
MFLIFKGFNKIIAIRLPKQTVKKRIAIELVLSLHEPPKYVNGYLGYCQKKLKVFPIFPFLWKKHLRFGCHLGTLGTIGTNGTNNQI